MNALTAEVIKPNYLRHPGWRWNVALRCMVDGSDTDSVIRSARLAADPCLVEACEFYRGREEIASHSDYHRMQHPVIHEAFMLRLSANFFGGYKWLLEALLMTDASNKEIADQFHPLYGEDTVEMFRKVFFDVDHYRSNPANMLVSVFANSMQTTHSSTDCDFTWKAFAYQRGFEAFLELIRFRAGGLLPAPHVSFIREVAKQRAYYNAYHVSASLRASYNQAALALFDHADKLWHLEKVTEQLGDREDMGKLTAQAVLTSLEQALTDPGIEARVAAEHSFAEPCLSSRFVPDLELEKRALPRVGK